MTPLVPGRECGSCRACCVVTAIDSAEITKPSGVACRHAGAGGCGIYETRPAVCRDFYCGWRMSALIPDGWRPDRSGIFILFGKDGVPPRFGGATGITLMLIGNPLQAVRQPQLLDFVSGCVTQAIPVFLAVPGPRGHQAVSVLLNEPQMEAAGRENRAAVRVLLEQSLKRFAAHEFPPYVMTQQGIDVSS